MVESVPVTVADALEVINLDRPASAVDQQPDADIHPHLGIAQHKRSRQSVIWPEIYAANLGHYSLGAR